MTAVVKKMLLVPAHQSSVIKHLLHVGPWLMLETQSKLDMGLVLGEATVLLCRQC